MNVKQFCQQAITHGYKKSNVCIGWDWIKDNLALLDDIFRSEQYRACDGMKYKCMPILTNGQDLTPDELDALSTAWYLQNDREHNRRRQELKDKMLAEGWILLNENVCQQAIQQKRKIELCGAVTSDWLTTKIEGLYRPIITANNRYFLIAPRKRNRGFYLGNLVEGGHRDCFCKIN